METDGQMVGDMAVPSQNLYSNIQVGSMRLVARSDGAGLRSEGKRQRFHHQAVTWREGQGLSGACEHDGALKFL